MYRGVRVLLISGVVIAVGGLGFFAASQEVAGPEAPRARRGAGQPAVEGPGRRAPARRAEMAPGAVREGAPRQAAKETVAELEKRILAQVRNNRPDLLPRLKELRNTDRKEYVKALRDIARQARGAGRGETGGTGPAVQRIRERVRDLAAEFRTAPAERRAQIRRQLEGAVSRLIDARHEQRKAAMVKAIVSRITGAGAGRARAGAGGIIPQAQRGRFGPGAGQRFGAGGGAGQVPMERSRQAPGGWYGPGQGRGPAMQQMGPQGRQGPRLGGGTPQTRGWQFQQEPRSWRRR